MSDEHQDRETQVIGAGDVGVVSASELAQGSQQPVAETPFDGESPFMQMVNAGLISATPALPALGGVAAVWQAVQVLNLVTGVLADAIGARDKLTALNAEIEKMVAEGVPPSDDQVQEMLARHVSASSRIQGA